MPSASTVGRCVEPHQPRGDQGGREDAARVRRVQAAARGTRAARRRRSGRRSRSRRPRRPVPPRRSAPTCSPTASTAGQHDGGRVHQPAGVGVVEVERVHQRAGRERGGRRGDLHAAAEQGRLGRTAEPGRDGDRRGRRRRGGPRRPPYRARRAGAAGRPRRTSSGRSSAAQAERPGGEVGGDGHGSSRTRPGRPRSATAVGVVPEHLAEDPVGVLVAQRRAAVRRRLGADAHRRGDLADRAVARVLGLDEQVAGDRVRLGQRGGDVVDRRRTGSRRRAAARATRRRCAARTAPRAAAAARRGCGRGRRRSRSAGRRPLRALDARR